MYMYVYTNSVCVCITLAPHDFAQISRAVYGARAFFLWNALASILSHSLCHMKSDFFGKWTSTSVEARADMKARK